jgi:hypothetical protein
MIEHIWTVICSEAVVDRQTNNISLHSILERLDVMGPVFPATGQVVVPVNMNLVTLWSRTADNEPCSGQARVNLIAPNGVSSRMNEYRIDLTQHSRNRSIFRFMGLPISGEGRYIFQVELLRENAWIQVARTPLEVAHHLPPLIPPIQANPGQ